MTAAWLNMQAINAKAKNTDSETAELLDKAMHLVDESCKEVRAVSHNMMPNALLKKGLVNAVREFLQQINVKSTKINLQTEGLNSALPNHVETVLYRVIQESVNNVIKHAQATSLDISITQDEAGIDVMIEDNGKGFNFSEANKKDGIGLQNIKSRIEYLKGTVEWNTAENKGTLVAIHIPETT
jgi:two-component system, NarL family, sensor kinase